MHSQLENKLASLIRTLLERGMPLESATLDTLFQVLGTHEVDELAVRLSDPEDAEAWSMRDLVLFPDQSLALAMEDWLLEQEQGDSKAAMPDREVVAELLAQVRLRVRLPDRTEFWLTLHKEEARLLTARLHLGKSLPASLQELLTQPFGLDQKGLVLGLRWACKQARLPWTPSQEAFVLALLRDCLPDPDPNPAQTEPKPKTPHRPLDMVRWTVSFLEHAGGDIPTALARRRETLLRYLDQAEEMVRVREAHNFETRRMLGIPEQHFDPEAFRDELALIELATRATGSHAPIHQVMHRNLGDMQTVKQAADVLD